MPDLFTADNKQSHGLLHSFCRYPTTTFQSQHKHEVVALTLRMHPFTQLGWMSVAFVIFLLPPFFSIFLLNKIPQETIMFLSIFWWSICVSFVFYNILRWIFNVGIVTNERILDIDYLFIQKEVTEAATYDVTDITSKTTGFFQDVFNYGDVFIQTAGTNQNVEFLMVPRPNEVVGIISKLAQSTHGNN